MNVKALVLSGGMGSRLRPLTDHMPKQLIPIANKPVLIHCLERIREAGIKEVGLIVGDRGTAIEAVVGNGRALGLDVTYIHQESPAGLAHCVRIARKFLGDDDFVMYLGDVVLGGPLEEHLELFAQHRPAAHLVLTKVATPWECGVAEVDAGGTVLGVEEKPLAPRSDLAMTGVYVFTPAIHQAVRSIPRSARNEWEITDAVQWLIDSGRPVRAGLHTGFWQDTGRVEGILECNRALLDGLVSPVGGPPSGSVDEESSLTGSVLIEPGARLVRSHVVGPAIIGAGALMEDSFAGPYTVLGDGCTLRHAGIERSIVLDGAELIDAGDVRDCLIGRTVTITKETSGAPGSGLTAGDDARVGVNV